MYLNLDYFFSKFYDFLVGVFGFLGGGELDYFGFVDKLKTAKIVAFVFSLFVFAGVVYCFYRILGIHKRGFRELAKFIWEPLPEERINKWDVVKKLMASEFQRDWKQGIVRADALLEEIIMKINYIGANFEEKLVHISPFQLESIKGLRWAHQSAVRIAGSGETYEITKEEADEIISAFGKALKDLGYM